MSAINTADQVQIHGPLEEHVEGFKTELRRLGFTPASVVNQLYLLAHLSRWLEREGIGLQELTVLQVDVFLQERKATYTALFTRRALRPLLGWLAESGVIVASARPLPWTATPRTWTPESF